MKEAYIPYGESVIQHVEESLRIAFGGGANVALTRRRTRSLADCQLHLASWDRTVEDDGDVTHFVRHILGPTKAETGFLYGCCLVFRRPKEQLILEHSSVTVFIDLAAGEVIPLFRAEWDALAAADASQHAQPHWHFVQHPKRLESILRTVLLPATKDFDQAETESVFSGVLETGLIHFAMSSFRFVSGQSRSKELYDEAEFKQWFRSLTKYISMQITYLLETRALGESNRHFD